MERAAQLPDLSESEMGIVSELVCLGLDRDDPSALCARLGEVDPPARERILASLSGYLRTQVRWLASRAHPSEARYRDLEGLLRAGGLWRDGV